MKHQKAGRKLGVLPDHRIALLRSLTLALLEKDSIQTTPARAKELRWYAERVVTLAKRGDVSGRRRIVQLLGATETQPGKPNRVRSAIEKIYSDLVPRFKTRPGGYTQIFRLAMNRVGDNAEQCIIRYIPADTEAKKAKKPGQKGGKAVESKDKGGVKAALKGGKDSEKKAAAPKEAKEKKSEPKDLKDEPEDKPVKAKKSDKEKA